MTSENYAGGRIALYTLGAVSYGVVGYVGNVLQDDDVSFDGLKFGKTVAVGLVAGLIMAAGGEEFSHEAIVAAGALAIPIVDQLLNAAVDTVGGSGSSPDRSGAL